MPKTPLDLGNLRSIDKDPQSPYYADANIGVLISHGLHNHYFSAFALYSRYYCAICAWVGINCFFAENSDECKRDYESFLDGQLIPDSLEGRVKVRIVRDKVYVKSLEFLQYLVRTMPDMAIMVKWVVDAPQMERYRGWDPYMAILKKLLKEPHLFLSDEKAHFKGPDGRTLAAFARREATIDAARVLLKKNREKCTNKKGKLVGAHIANLLHESDSLPLCFERTERTIREEIKKGTIK